MSKYSFIINVGNAIDKSHFRMYFHESISTRKLSMFDIEDLSELSGTAELIGKHIDRNVFEADSNCLYICMSRTWQQQTDLMWWELFIRLHIYSSIPEEVRKKIKKICLILIDYDDNGGLRDPDRKHRADQALLSRGYLDDTEVGKDWDLDSHPVITLGQLKETAELYIKEDYSDDDRTTIISGFTGERSGSAYSSFVSEIFEGFRKNQGLKLEEIIKTLEKHSGILSGKLKVIDSVTIMVDPDDQAEKRLSQIRLVTFLVKLITGDSNESISSAYNKHEKEFAPQAEAARLLAFSKRIDEENRKIEQRTEKSRNVFSCHKMRELMPLTDDKIIGNDEDIKNTLDRVLGFRNKENWEDEFEDLLSDIAAYEDKLKEYGREVNEEFHRYKKESVNSVEEYDSDLAEIEDELKNAYENSYRERDKDDNVYAQILEITNQFNKVGTCLRKLNNAKIAGKKTGYGRLFLFMFLMILIPYSIMQTYIYTGFFRGNFWPLVCIGVLLAAIVLTKPIASISLDQSFNREVRLLQEQVRHYFEGIRQRQRTFYESVNSMIAIWNAQQKYDACEAAADERLMEHQRIEYHKNALKKFQHSMKYFAPFIDNYYDDGSNYNVQTDKTKLDIDKNIVDNTIYWIDKIAGAA